MTDELTKAAQMCDDFAAPDMAAALRGQPVQAGEVDERVAFEAWCASRGMAVQKVPGIDTYASAFTAYHWAAWQARASLPTQPAAQAAPEPLHLFEFWWEAHMPQATQAQAWAAWTDAQNSKGSAIDAAQPATPQQAAGEPVGFIVSVVLIKETANGFNTQNKLYAVAAASREEAHGKALPLSHADFPEHSLHTICSYEVTHPAPGVPEGFALVPVEPTDEMVMAGALAHQRSPCHDFIGPIGDAWVAMLAAAQAKGADHG